MKRKTLATATDSKQQQQQQPTKQQSEVDAFKSVLAQNLDKGLRALVNSLFHTKGALHVERGYSHYLHLTHFYEVQARRSHGSEAKPIPDNDFLAEIITAFADNYQDQQSFFEEVWFFLTHTSH